LKKATLLVLVIFMFTSILFCGNGEEQSAIDRRNEYLAEQEQKSEPPSTNPEELTLSPEVLAEDAVPGTCAEAAIKFATAFSDLDTLTALPMTGDTLKLVVRTIMTRPDQMASMRQAKEMGFRIKAAKIVEDQEDSTLCQACVTAFINGLDIDDCSFMFKLKDEQWILYDFGSY
jgi:hypothetical protein